MTTLTETLKKVEATNGRGPHHLGFEEAERYRLLKLRADYTALVHHGNVFQQIWYGIKENRLRKSADYRRFVSEPAARENAARLAHSPQAS